MYVYITNACNISHVCIGKLSDIDDIKELASLFPCSNTLEIKDNCCIIVCDT